jgi:hypothetical protein
VLVGAVVLVVAVTGGALAWREATAERCADLTMTLEADGAGTTTQEVRPDEVLVQTASFNVMSPISGDGVTVTAHGRALLSGSITDPTTPPRSREARLTGDSVDALRRCVTGSGFQAAEDSALGRGGSGTSVCAVADADEVVLTAGPASGAPKSVSVYALGFASCLDHPAALLGLDDALDQIGRAVASRGVDSNAVVPDVRAD